MEPYAGINEYFKTNDRETWTYKHFLNEIRETIIISPPYSDDWSGLDGAWFRRYIYHANKDENDKRQKMMPFFQEIILERVKRDTEKNYVIEGVKVINETRFRSSDEVISIENGVITNVPLSFTPLESLESDLFVNGINISEKFRTFINEAAYIVWFRFIGTNSSKIYTEITLRLDIEIENLYRSVIKTCLDESRINGTKLLCRKLVEKSEMMDNFGFLIQDLIRTLPYEKIRNDPSELTLITNYLDSIMKNAFHVPDNHIVQWSNTALSESKVRKFDGLRAKQPDFVVSVNYQSQSANVIYVGEVTGPAEKNNVFKNHLDLIRIGIFMKDCPLKTKSLFKRKTLDTPKFNKLVSKTRNVKGNFYYGMDDSNI
ncbi:11165_t:CDS:2 [Funneliformis caledonium]|uniref:11165_t:CDS:1 n=1 Tax=Funneliformis caledonium TaxID=1117310 RepID=A0A9N9FIF2_9GLOM|nr:11165_t:CDS:2 [Funneliformis caledonium]